jgi:hypothetical protein
VTATDDYKNVNFQNLTAEVKTQYGIEEKGSGQVLGKDCKKYEMTYKSQGQEYKSTVWIWKGISLKTEMTVMGTSIVYEATEVTEGNVPKEKLDLPAGITFNEPKAQKASPFKLKK